ncbi:Mbeg1-like protein [Marivita sp. S0852]|uniref:Mbeg1-like protein n=1 Tax=Marivita sp. S0852 TaxID=3373893 RepID=UPI003982B9F4
MPTVYQLALMAEDIYTRDDSGIYAASFPDPAPADLPDAATLNRLSYTSDNGFAAAVYETHDAATITYRGIDASADPIPVDAAPEDVPPQFARAIAFAEAMIKDHHLVPDRTYLCGHSLGGALTKYVAHHLAGQNWLAAAAVSFNGPGLSVSMLDRALVAGMSRLTDDLPVGVGVRAVHRLMQQADVPLRDQTKAHLININLDGDIVSRIGDAAGVTFTLTAPDFVCPAQYSYGGRARLPIHPQARIALLREVYLHSMHTLRRVLADDPLGRAQARDLLDHQTS